MIHLIILGSVFALTPNQELIDQVKTGDEKAAKQLVENVCQMKDKDAQQTKFIEIRNKLIVIKTELAMNSIRAMEFCVSQPAETQEQRLLPSKPAQQFTPRPRPCACKSGISKEAAKQSGLFYGIGGGFIAVSALTFSGAALGLIAAGVLAPTSANQSTVILPIILAPAFLGAIEAAIGSVLIWKANEAVDNSN